MTWLRPPAPRTALALLAGLLWALAFPSFQIPMLAWIAPGMLLLTGLGVRVGEAARLGYLAGLVHHLTALYWLLNIPFAVGNVAGWFALSAYCALFPAIWLGLAIATAPRPDSPSDSSAAARSRRTRFGNDPFALGSAPIKLRGPTWDALREVLCTSGPRRQAWLMMCALSWVGLEFFRGWFLSGFPWNFLGASQYELIPLIQIASVAGIHGVSFMVVWVSLAMAAAAATVILRPQLRFAWKNELALALIALLLIIAWGVVKTTRPRPASDRLATLALVQPSIPQTLIFDPASVTNRFSQLLELTRTAITNQPDLIIWPEASLPALTSEAFEQLRTLIRAANIPIIFGADDVEPDSTQPAAGRYNSYNAAFLFNGDGQFVARYRKQRLVIFGEYTPGVRWLPFLADWSPAGTGFSAGAGPTTFYLESFAAKVEPNICFEDNFTDLVRAQVEPDTDFLLNLTNNGWFGESAAQWQHAANAVFRAVENNVPLVRCTNNGLTCWIDEQGRLRQVFKDESGSVYGSGVAVFQVPLLPAGTVRKQTFFGRFGDWFGWACLGVTAASYLLTRFKPRTSNQQ